MNGWRSRVSNFALVLVSTLILFCPAPAFATAQSEPARVTFHILLQDLSDWTSYGASTTIIIELRNIHRPSDTPERLVLTTKTLDTQVNDTTEDADKDSYSLQENRSKWLRLFQGDVAVVELQISELAWSNDAGTIVFRDRWKLDPSAHINVQLEPGRYRVSATVRNEDGTISIIDEERDYVEGWNRTIQLRQPGRLSYLFQLLATREGVLGTIIFALLTILVGVLKDNIASAFSKLLDFLGKYLGGRLAERRFLKKYLDQLIFNHKYLKLIGFNTAGISRPLLEEVFVLLRIAANVGESKQSQPISFNDAFKQYRSMVILGGPGAGKTTTLSYALLAYAKNKANEQLGVDERLLPIYVPLRRLSNTNRSIIEDVTDKETQILSAEILKEYPTEYFERRLKKRECLVLLDGLDEVLNEKTHRQIAQRINDLVAAYPGNRFLVTCRTAGWNDLLSGDFAVLSMQDFDREEIQRFVLGWHKAVITQSEYMRLQLDNPDKKRFEKAWEAHKEEVVRPAIDIQSRNLVHAIDSNNRILAIAVNPMLLSLISLVHLNRKFLPRGRTVLYSQCLDHLIDLWERAKGFVEPDNRVTTVQKEAVLREIAFDFQLRGKGEDSRDNLEQLIARIAAKLGISMPPKDLLEDIETRSGLLTERSLDVFGFTHLTLQEYLVAKHIQLNQAHTELLKRNFDNQAWREVILLYTGLVDDATDLIAGVASSDSLERQILAGYCVGDAQHCSSELAQRIIDRILSELVKRNEREDELVTVIAAIARDYQVEAVSVEEKLSKDLLLRIYDTNISAADRLHAITAMGRARVTQALPALICLFELDDERTRAQARAAVIQFGDLALPTIESFLKVNLITNPGMKALVPVLAGINTGSSAMSLIRLYRFQNPDLERRISLALASMMTSPLVEAELLELEDQQIPSSLSLIPIDRNGWSYKGARSGWWHIDTKIRQDVENCIAATHNEEAVDTDIFSAISFKVLFPAFLSYVKTWPKRWRQDPSFVRRTFELLAELGFDGQRFEIFHSIGQIQAQPEMPLDLALQRIAGTEGNYSYSRPRGDILWHSLANVYFMSFWAVQLYLWFLNFRLWATYDFSRRTMSVEQIVLFSSDILSLMLYLLAMLVTLRKLRIPISSLQFVKVLINPIPNILKVLPYITKLTAWTKLIGLLILIIGLSKFPFVVKDVVSILLESRLVYIDPIGLFILTSPLFLIPATLYYWEYRVLAQNPIYELITMHPRGRQLIGAANQIQLN